MRYLVACERFFGDVPSGGARVAWELARLMRSRGHEVAMLVGDELCKPAVECVDGIEIARFPTPRLGRMNPRRFTALRQAAATAYATHLDRPWDVVHGHMISVGLAVFQSAPREARRLITIHSPAVMEQDVNWRDGTMSGLLKRIAGMPLLRRAERRYYEQADGLTVLSDFTARMIRSLFGEEVASKTVKIPWWTDADRPLPSRSQARAALGWPQETPVVFTLRRLVPRMGLGDLVESAKILRERGSPAVVVIAGEGPQREQLECRIAALGLTDRVRLIGRLSDEHIEYAYAACDVFALPTRELECFGIIAIDALAKGRPVVATRVGAIPEILEPIHADALVPPGAPEALASALHEVLRGHGTPPADTLRAYAARHFGKRLVADAYIDFLEHYGARKPI